MASILESLNRTVGTQSGQQDAELLYPYARALEPGFNIRNLPMPPVESAFVCLRMAREHPRVRFFWNHEANSISSFTEYFLKVYSPGNATHSDLIIVNGGLYWLFLECKNVASTPEQKADFAKQATVCRDSLETVLSNLPFHQPSNMDSTCAMMLAAMYCLDTCKPSAAWNFIATASQMSQTLGMHSIVAMSQDDAETKAQKIKLFWLIYMQEKGLSLRLGRSSTIRDSDITIPPLTIDAKQDTALYGQLQKWTEFGSLQGRVYDQIYSPGALILPQNVRIARARQLASELEAHSTKTSAGEKRYMEVLRDAVGERFFEAFVSTTRVTHLSLFCLIYRAIPAEPNEGTVFGKECITSAREALRAHKRCMAVVADFEQDIIETYINWALLQSPFVPFIVLFCHIIETLNESDLALLGSLVEILQSASADSFSMGVIKEIRLFKVLYDVACKYVTLKSNGQEADTDPWADAASLFMPPPIQPVASPAIGQGLSQTIFAGPGQSDFGSGTTFTNNPAWQPGDFGITGELGMEVDPQGTQFGNWLYLNNQMMRVLEDSYF
ncbi:putative transcriptional regulatory protein [Colletotrichum sidae]|uniref:Putative transcriptional regulatory protein n=1 Tax=Colletotrichum sidae TaxID=1347389 RepID=A0A4R8TLI7_9PEZI|nr:putative transcriptional regulatory protein [Colletotrichum sidae]